MKSVSEYYKGRWYGNLQATCNVGRCLHQINLEKIDGYPVCFKHYYEYQLHKDDLSRWDTIKEKIVMAHNKLREKIREALRDEDDRVLINAGFIYPSGALTLEGRKVVADLQFEGYDNAELRPRAIELAQILVTEDCPKTKKSKK